MNDPKQSIREQPSDSGVGAAGSRAQRDAGDASSPDAPPSNRASDRCNLDICQRVWHGLDFLEMSFHGTLLEGITESLAELKAKAQHSLATEQAKAQIQLAGHIFLVRDKGSGRFPYVLQDDRFYIKVKGSGARALPLAYAQIRSEYIAHKGVVPALAELREVVTALGECEGEPIVSRIDLAVDFVSGVDMDSWDRRAWITRAEYKQSHTVGDRFSGWSIGLKGPIAARLYDKVLEVATQSKKVHLFDLWKQGGWCPGDSVWRLEIQLRRPVLAQFSLSSLADVLEARAGLWRYATTEWLRLTVLNSEDATRARWDVHPLWEGLAAVVWEGSVEVLTRRYGNEGVPSNQWVARAATGVLTTIMAKDVLEYPDDAFKAMRAIVTSYWQEQEVWEGAPMLQLLRDRALVKERRYGEHRLADKLGICAAKSPRVREPGEDDDLDAKADAYRKASRGGGK